MAAQRPLFALLGMVLAASFFSLPPSERAATATTATISAVPAVTVATTPSRLAAGDLRAGPRVPLGLKRKGLRALVTGGAGFVGSHLVDRLMERGDSVIVVDNFFTGMKENVAHHLGNPNFELIRHDVVEPILLEVDQIYHLACPASPVHYKYNPIKTIISFAPAKP